MAAIFMIVDAQSQVVFRTHVVGRVILLITALVDQQRAGPGDRAGGEDRAAAGRLVDHHLGAAVVGVHALGPSSCVFGGRTGRDLVGLVPRGAAGHALVQRVLAEQVAFAQAGAGERPSASASITRYGAAVMMPRSSYTTPSSVRFRFVPQVEAAFVGSASATSQLAARRRCGRCRSARRGTRPRSSGRCRRGTSAARRARRPTA